MKSLAALVLFCVPFASTALGQSCPLGYTAVNGVCAASAAPAARIACIGTPGNTTGSLGGQCYTATSLYQCNGTITVTSCALAGDWGLVGPVNGLTSYPLTTAGDLFVGGTSGAPSRLADAATGQVMASGGAGVAPAYTATPSISSLTTGSGGTGCGVINGCMAFSLGSTAGTPTAGSGYLRGDSVANCIEFSANGSVEACVGATASVPLSSVTAASIGVTIANANFPIVWNWAQSTNAQAGITFGETTAASGTGDIGVLISNLATSTSTPLQVTNSSAVALSKIAAFVAGSTNEAIAYASGLFYANAAIGIGIGPNSCVPGTANVLCMGVGSAPTPETGSYNFFPSTSAIAMFQAQINGGGNLNVVMVQPSAVHVVAQTATITGASLCAASAGACNKPGQYHIHLSLLNTATACSTVGSASLVPTITWNDTAGTAHINVPFPMITQLSGTAFATSFIPTVTVLTAWASGDMNISTNGTAFTYTATYTTCNAGGNWAFQVDASTTRLQ